LLATLAAEA